jgi:hydroxypyruvate isomerase
VNSGPLAPIAFATRELRGEIAMDTNDTRPVSNSPHGQKSAASAISRREMLVGSAAGLAAATLVGGSIGKTAVAAESGGKVPMKGRINHSIVQWCYSLMGDKWTLDQLCEQAKSIGVKSVELVDAADWPTLKKHGLTCAIAFNNMPPPQFAKGFNNKKYHAQLIEGTKKAIDESADFGCPSVIAFTGYKWRDADDPKSGEISLDEGAKNCVEGFKQVMAHAEKKKINICIEMLNTRADDHPMKGHPGYQGDHIDYCMDICKAVGSPNMKLLFDFYHVQIMDGDLVRRVHQCKDYIGHIHTAGNPGRCELDAKQEINYAACMQALLDIGYKGWVGHEFIPTRDAAAGLREAVAVCDI